MQDFNHPDPQNDRRTVQPTNSEPVQNTQQQVPPPVPSSNQVPPVPPIDSATQTNQQPYQAPQQQYQQQPQQNTYQQPQQQYQQPVQQQQYQTPVPPVAQPTYQQQYQQQNRVQQTVFPPVKTGEWMLTMFLMSIPLIGSIMLFVWAFSSGTNPSKSNWAKATLIWGVIFGILMVIVYAIIFLVAGITFNGLNL
ncbi:MAG TPA: hypothetical protein PKN32_06070 [Bacteroidales bacterium]|nr:hypothetical protein [Bacteroidales bacterium]